MKIAINTRFLMPNKLEGMGWFTHEVVKRWVKWHPEHEFLFIFDRPFSEEFIFADNVTGVHTFPPARHPFLFYWWYEWSVPRLLKKHQPDVFVSPDGFSSLSVSIPTLFVLHDIAWKHFPHHLSTIILKYCQHFIPQFAKQATHIATVSEYSKQDIMQAYDIAASKIDVVYNGSHANYQPLSEIEKNEIRTKYTQGQPYFLYLGSIHPRKNIPNLLRAFEAFKQQCDSPLKLVLAGRMAWKTGEVGDLLATLACKEDIIFLGYVENEILPKVVAAAYALTYVSLFEGFGIPLLEAMYCDVPSITSNCSSMPEVVGDAGLLANPNDVASISQQMLRLWSEDGLREDLIQKGKIQRQKFSWDLTAEKMWTTLLKTIEGHKV